MALPMCAQTVKTTFSSEFCETTFFVCASMGNAAYIIFIMWNSISGLDTWYHFWLNINCGVAVTVRSYQKKSDNFLRGVERGGQNIFFGGEGQFFRLSSIFRSSSLLMSSSFLMLFLFLRLSSLFCSPPFLISSLVLRSSLILRSSSFLTQYVILSVNSRKLVVRYH